MFSTLSRKFVEFSSKFTYRQRFIFWVSLYFIFTPMPLYWILSTQYCFSRRAELQLKGSEQARIWLGVYDALTMHYVAWAHSAALGGVHPPRLDALKLSVDHAMDQLKSLSLPESKMEIARESLFNKSLLVVNFQEEISFLSAFWTEIQALGEGDAEITQSLYNKLLSKLARKIHEVAYDYHLVLQTDTAMAQLSRAIYFYFVRQQLQFARLSSYLTSSQKRAAFGDLSLKIGFARNKIHETFSSLDMAYRSAKTNKWWNDLEVERAQEQRLDCYQLSSRFLDALETDLVTSNGQTTASDERYPLLVKSLECMSRSRSEANALFDQVVKNEKSFYLVQEWIVYVFYATLAILLAIFLAFRFFTRHFLQMESYIRGLSKGKFVAERGSNPTDEMGKIEHALKTMGKAIGGIVHQLRELDGGIARAADTIERTAHSQTKAVAQQESWLLSMDGQIKQIADNSRALANTMGQFTKMAQESLKEDTSQADLNQMQIKMNALKDASNKILGTLATLSEKEAKAHALTRLMTKISDQASLLALNAAIEALNVGANEESFIDITDKIQNFAERVASATKMIQKIVGEMQQAISIGRTTAESCVREITVCANRLIEVGRQLKSITSHDEVQNAKYEVVNDLMQAQAMASETIKGSVSSLDAVSRETSHAVKSLFLSIQSLGVSSDELRRAVSSLFSESEKGSAP